MLTSDGRLFTSDSDPGLALSVVACAGDSTLEEEAAAEWADLEQEMKVLEKQEREEAKLGR